MADQQDNTKDIENTDIANGANKDSGGANKINSTKKLSADAPIFAARSPTLDPYAGPNGIRTRPGIVEPATIPPPQQQQQPQPPQQQTQQQQQVHQQQVHQQQVHQQQAQHARQQNQATGQTTAQQQAQQAQQQHLSQQRHPRTRTGYPQGIMIHDHVSIHIIN